MKFYRSYQGVNALTFDLDDTLYDNYPIIKLAEEKLLQWLALRLPQTSNYSKAHWQALNKEVIEFDISLQSHVTLRRKAVLELVALRNGFSAEKAEDFADEALVYFLYERSNFTLPPSLFSLLDKLAARFPLLAITNGNVNCEMLKLSPYFEHILKAGFDGKAKPHKQLYEKAQKLLDLPPSRILHIGDSLTTDVAGAKRANFYACWLNIKAKPITTFSSATLLPDMEITKIDELTALL